MFYSMGVGALGNLYMEPRPDSLQFTFCEVVNHLKYVDPESIFAWWNPKQKEYIRQSSGHYYASVRALIKPFTNTITILTAFEGVPFDPIALGFTTHVYSWMSGTVQPEKQKIADVCNPFESS